MKIKSSFILGLVFCIAAPVFSQTADLKQIQAGTGDFVQAMADALPLSSTLGLNWSDAYIGQLLGIPPHFGAGLAVGFTTVKADAINDLLDSFGISLPSGLDTAFPMPAYTGEMRIGGFGIPFDLGFKAGYLPPIDLSNGVEFNYFLIGGDFRYGILEDKAIFPGVSVGLGVYHLSGGVGANLPDQNFAINNNNTPVTMVVNDARGDFNWETTTLELKAQVSKKLLIITPYLGLGLNYAWTSAGYEVKGKLDYPAGFQDALVAAGITGIDLDGKSGFSSIQETSGLGFRVFGGLAFNIVVVKIDLTGMVDIHGNFGASLGLRFQL
jgi:hypothetical protein